MAQSGDRPNGIAIFGRRVLFSAAFALAFGVSLIPSALLVGLVVFAQSMLGIAWSAWEFPLWGALAAAPLFYVGLWTVQAATPLWRRLDPSEEILEIGR